MDKTLSTATVCPLLPIVKDTWLRLCSVHAAPPTLSATAVYQMDETAKGNYLMKFLDS